MIDCGLFAPEQSLFEGPALAECRASVIIPLRNEEASLASALNALTTQVDTLGHPLEKSSYEVLVLLNNCTDRSSDVICNWKRSHADAQLHVAERTFPAPVAHVGTARRLLMDTAWRRLKDVDSRISGILSTDSDTTVAPDWIAQNLRAIEAGADAVGGVIKMPPEEIASLPEGARTSYFLDRQYQSLVAELESLLDPLDYDPWPRHLEHFGASLACTPQAYAFAGGLPPVVPLEDVAFVDALSRADARLRHDPGVVVFTSARLDGRAEVGLSYQLREWQRMADAHEECRVPSTQLLTHKLSMRSTLRALYGSGSPQAAVSAPTYALHRVSESWSGIGSFPAWLGDPATERLIVDTFEGDKTQPIDDAILNLSLELSELKEAHRRREASRTSLDTL